MNIPKSERMQWIDFAKFLGILFVLLSHMELRIPYISDFGYLFYVPIFFLLAGYTYHQREESIWNFVKRKGKRLLVPYFGYSIFLYLFFFIKDYLLKGIMSTQAFQPLLGILYARNSLYPLQVEKGFPNIQFMTILNSPMWFLPALFLSSLLFEICIRISKNSWKRLLVNNILIMAIGIFLIYVTPILLPWSLDTICLFEVFISAGYILRNEMETLETKKGKIAVEIITCVILFAVTMLLFKINGPMNVSVGDFGETISMGVAMGILSSCTIILLCHIMCAHIPEGAALIGRSSLTIMCLHMFIFMFVKTGINILNPTVFTQNTMLTVFLKAMGVSGTLAIVTIFDLCKGQLLRKRISMKK